jgi:hypothetical protein
METLKSVLSTISSSNITKYIGIVAYGVLCFCISLLFVQCSNEKAQQDIREAVGRAEAAETTVNTLNAENERLRETIARANDAVERALTLILEAQDSHEKRIETIENDPDAADWLTCELPDGVREAFADYYGH